MEEIRVPIEAGQNVEAVFGILDVNRKLLETHYGSRIVQRDNNLLIGGGKAEKTASALRELFAIVDSGEPLDEQKVGYVISLVDQDLSYRESNVNKDVICFTYKGKPLRPKTMGQTGYVRAIREHDLSFGIGPAGTGKTYIAVAMAVHAFKNKEVEKIILARPAVEAGERLGFLPGDLQEKVDPYLRPLYDALYDILGREAALRLKEREAIEVVPLAYMRGRTLDNSFIILDEAQNTTREQMKMFLTRMGFGSKAVITGDITQIDLPRGKASGLMDAVRVLQNVEGVSFSFLKEADVVRHSLVRRIIKAYDAYEHAHPAEENGGQEGEE